MTVICNCLSTVGLFPRRRLFPPALCETPCDSVSLIWRSVGSDSGPRWNLCQFLKYNRASSTGLIHSALLITGGLIWWIFKSSHQRKYFMSCDFQNKLRINLTRSKCCDKAMFGDGQAILFWIQYSVVKLRIVAEIDSPCLVFLELFTKILLQIETFLWRIVTGLLDTLTDWNNCLQWLSIV